MRKQLVFLVGLLGALAAANATATAENVTIPAAGSTPAIPGYLMRPAGAGRFPAVLVLHACEGMGALDTQTVDQLAKQGYVALAIDTLAPLGVKNACTNPSAVVTSARFAYASLGWLAAQPYVVADHLGVIGFSMGANEILGLVNPMTPRPPPPGLRVAVAYYPGCANRSSTVTLPLAIFDGDADDWTPAGPCAAFVQSAMAAGGTVQITTYPGVTHAFNQAAPGERTYLGHHLRYNAAATNDALAKTDAFLAMYLK